MTATTAAYLRMENDATVNVKVWENGRNTLTFQHPGYVHPVPLADLTRWATKQLQDAGFIVDKFEGQFADSLSPNLDLRAQVRYVPTLTEAAPSLSQSLRAGRGR